MVSRIPLAVDKVAGSSLALEFLGRVLDAHRMETRLPTEKLLRTQQVVSDWLSKKNAKKQDILSLVGTLQHASKVVRPLPTTENTFMLFTAHLAQEGLLPNNQLQGVPLCSKKPPCHSRTITPRLEIALKDTKKNQSKTTLH